MKKIDKYINCYDISKTLRFKAVPVGETLSNINTKMIIEEDEERANNFKTAKKLIDRYHRVFISRVLNNVKLKKIREYSELFYKYNKSDEEKELLVKIEDELRKEISDALINDEEYKKIMGNNIVKKILPEYLEDESELEVIQSFSDFFTAFEGFMKNRENIYSSEKIPTSIGYRCINDNLPKFLSNRSIFETVKTIFETDQINKLKDYAGLVSFEIEDVFKVDYFDYVLSQEGIDLYNSIIGGGFNEKGEKIQGLNEYINLYNQKNKTKYPKFKMLYKQILSESEQMSFYMEGFVSDEEVYKNIRMTVGKESKLYEAIIKINDMFERFEEYNQNGIYILNGPAINTLSNDVLGSWSKIVESWNKEYDDENLSGKNINIEKYERDRKNAYKKQESFSLGKIIELAGVDDFISKFKQVIIDKINIIEQKYLNAEQILTEEYVNTKKLIKDEKTIEIIKELLDSIKELEKYLKPILGTGKEDNRDEYFYGNFTMCLDEIFKIDELYNKVRNYVTAKPFSTDKFKLYFKNVQFMNGWSKTKEKDYRTVILRREGLYYLAIIDDEDKNCLSEINEDLNGDNYEKMDYYFPGDPSKQLPRICFSKKNLELFNPQDEVVQIYKNETFKKGDKFSLTDCRKLIDYYKKCLMQYEWSKEFDFYFSDTNTYNDLSDFYNELKEQAYKLSFINLSREKIDELVSCGKLYLFEIYCKDFSQKSHGNENLHTKYFKLIFDNRYHNNFRLSGGAELFLRKASIKKEDLIVHKANVAIENKNPDNPKKTTTLSYDIYKDKRYSENQFELHLPIKINSCSTKKFIINEQVRKDLKNDDNPYIIGIDRGERNLLYICVIDGQGNIVEQFSLNEIINEYNNIKMKTDYHTLLDKKEKERLSARQNWTVIENIKELKEGYISQVVHKICELVDKYDAVIAMEDLNSGFKNSRVKVEKQVYQKFEKMLINKLNYMSDKKKQYGEKGSVVNAYQLTNKFDAFARRGVQDGFIFYIPAWLTSKLDPATGFVNLLRTKYVSRTDSRNFISSFEDIKYSIEDDMFVFELDYNNFLRTDADYRKKWTLYTNGERIRTFRNSEKNNEFDYEIVNLTQAFKQLFEENGIDYLSNNLKEKIIENSSKEFFENLMKLISLMLQMRNSISGRVDVDYLISPVKGKNGKFYDSRELRESPNAILPKDADANGAYNIARKVLWAIEQFKQTEDEKLSKVKISISNKEWLKYAQTHTKAL